MTNRKDGIHRDGKRKKYKNQPVRLGGYFSCKVVQSSRGRGIPAFKITLQLLLWNLLQKISLWLVFGFLTAEISWKSRTKHTLKETTNHEDGDEPRIPS
jgi:hypothetical protein